MNDATPKLRLISASARNAPNFPPGFFAVTPPFRRISPVSTSTKLWSVPPVKKKPTITMSRNTENTITAMPTVSRSRGSTVSPNLSLAGLFASFLSFTRLIMPFKIYG